MRHLGERRPGDVFADPLRLPRQRVRRSGQGAHGTVDDALAAPPGDEGFRGRADHPWRYGSSSDGPVGRVRAGALALAACAGCASYRLLPLPSAPGAMPVRYEKTRLFFHSVEEDG